ncbi:MAG: hypothetical protein HY889_07120 [Deltaproteobacteria bacterium]|nr:hypothetical protein [Deltaproteobacteria bacterium]
MKNIGRLEEILMVLLRHGLGRFVDRLNLRGRLARISAEGKGAGQLSQGERIRTALEELGPTFVKFGQVLRLI